ncbi:MAG: YdcF family protein [Pseudomonadota bacterium]|nr:YdcF family protein [Pseudomonadota bacterium]
MKVSRLFLNTAIVLLIILLLPLVLIGISVMWTAEKSYDPKTTLSPPCTAVVLGAAVWKSQPSPVLQERVNEAVRLYQSGYINNIIFTGGLAEGDTLSEATAAGVHAQSLSIPPEHIILEMRSHTTEQNLRFAKPLIKATKNDCVVVITDPYHLRRALVLADHINFNVIGYPTRSSRYQSVTEKAKFLARETFQLYKLRFNALF